jgi:transposase
MAVKSKTGRPSKYEPQYCQALIKHMTEGLSFESFAAVIKVNQDTLHEWVKVHLEFSEAKKEAFSQNLLFWEKVGIEGLWGSKESSFNATVWIFSMKNRHKWRDKQPDETDVIVNNVNNMSDEEIKARLKKLMGEK